MNCPLCIDEVLAARHHAGIEIDVCPRCRGVWLDRGELEKIAGAAEPRQETRPPPPDRNDRDRSEDEKTRRKPKKDRRRRRKSLPELLADLIEEILD